MNLDFFNDLINKVKESDFVQNFMTELSDYLEKNAGKGVNELSTQENKKITNNREENCLYQVVDFSSNGVYLQNTNNNVIFEETEIPQELKDKISNDYILRYKDGKYIYEEELTENFMNSMVSVQEFQKIKEDFINDSNILEIDSNTQYKVESRENDYTILSYGDNKTMKVPNELIPFFAKEQSILHYKDGKFN